MIRFFRSRPDNAPPPGVVARAILALIWERGWRAIWRIMCVLGGAATLALLGVFDGMPPWLHGGILAVMAAAVAVMGWRSLPGWPDADEARRRVESASGLTHRPLRAAHDQRAAGDAGLWRAHQARMANRLWKEAPDRGDSRPNKKRRKSALRAGLPMPHLARLDPLAVRAAVVLAVIVAAAFAGDAGPGRLWRALTPQGTPDAPIIVDAWITPPDYTARAPIYLSRATGGAGGAEDADASAAEEDGNDRPVVTVPAGSVLGIHLTGARRKPELRFDGAMAGDAAGLSETFESGVYDARGTLTADGWVAIVTGSRQRARWQIAVRPDRAPTIAFAGPVGATDSATMLLEYEMSDDYGVEEASARIVLPTGADTHPADATDAEAIIIPLRLPSGGAGDGRAGTGMTYHDLTAHHWAGLPVAITLRAVDGAGNSGRSAPMSMVLPAREFSDPLARAVIEQRRALASGAATGRQAARVLDALSAAPARHIADKAAYLGLRAAYWRLRRSAETVPEGTYALMWDVALRLEDGDLSLAERSLRAAQEALMAALESGASDTEIEELLADLRRALERFLQALAREGQDNVQPTAQGMTPGESVSPQDLERMLNAAADLSRTGAREQARELLSQMQGILENLRPSGMSAEAAARQAQAMQALEGLGDLIDEQQRLMDETAQWNREAGRTGDGEGEAAGTDDMGAALGDRQEALRQTLESLTGELAGAGIEAPAGLGEADGAMGAAGNHLRGGGPGQALPEQARALEALRQGAGEAARQFMESMQSAGGGGPGRRDPLGRPMRESGSGGGGEGVVRSLEGSDIQRAFEIQRELRRRSGERLRPAGELEYLNRLLRRFSPRQGGDLR